MFCVSLRLFPSRVIKPCLIVVCAVAFLSVPAARSFAQKPGADTPQFSDFKGVRIGMPTEEVRKKLGSPRDKGDEQDFYVFNDTQAVQIFYDKASKKVTAISIDFMSGANQIPAAKESSGARRQSRRLRLQIGPLSESRVLGLVQSRPAGKDTDDHHYDAKNRSLNRGA